MKPQIRRIDKNSMITFRLEDDLALAIEEMAAEFQISQAQLIRTTMRQLAHRLKVLPLGGGGIEATQKTEMIREIYPWLYKQVEQ